MEAAQSTDANAWTPEAAARERTAREAQRADRMQAEAREQQAAKNWVREHQDVALVAAFALGVFMGVWMKG